MAVVIKSARSDRVLGTNEEAVLRSALRAYAGSKSSVVDGDERKVAVRILMAMGDGPSYKESPKTHARRVKDEKGIY